VSSEHGLVWKDDVTDYTVHVELANPYRIPLTVEVIDQYPVTPDKHVEIRLTASTPAAQVDAIKGALKWRLQLAPSSKQVVSFGYRVTRPKGWRLHQ
jgi:hypothetical protein